jgi:hypothetical protein
VVLRCECLARGGACRFELVLEPARSHSGGACRIGSLLLRRICEWGLIPENATPVIFRCGDHAERVNDLT